MNTVKLTIDGRSIEVEASETVLSAARRLGIEIPTLCHVEGIEPSASCFLCMVEVEGRPTHAPSCALPVAEGMIVRTDTEEIRAGRRMALELLLSDHAGDCVAPCSVQCPAGLDIPGFLHPLANGDPGRAHEVTLERLAFPGALGRVCPRLCERSCRRCALDDGLAIGSLHRYTADRDRLAEESHRVARAPDSGKRVAIVGAGPAGLAAAFYLARKGHACELYEAHEHAGGMLRYGIPEYRLPKDTLDAEIDTVRRLGAAFHFGQRWGEDFTLDALREQHDAVFVAIGAQRSRGLGCPGEEHATSGIAFLEAVTLGKAPELGRSVVVVGGGNTAMDAARSAARIARVQRPDADVDVRVLYRRTRDEMPCLLEEVEAAEFEGIPIDYLVAPVALARRADETLELTCERMQLGEPDASGRRRPVPIPGSTFTLEATCVITAIGQSVDLDLARREGLAVTDWGIAVDERTLATNLAGVFAGGDGVLGPDLAVRAVAAGRIAATSIDQHMSGRPVLGVVEPVNVALQRIAEDELAALFREIERSPRKAPAELSKEDRHTSFAEVDLGLTDERAFDEAHRCMTCGCRKADGCTLRRHATEYGVNPTRFVGERRHFRQNLTHPEVVYEPGKCIACDACVRVAATHAEPLGVALIGRGFEVAMAVPFDRPLSEGLRTAAKACAEACPTGALSLRTSRACDLCQLASNEPDPRTNKRGG
ncbi:MAG: FAD-dependent oxidoreductase [Planctomycetes bacterium]|nr:FAD-dependent oxidoreductase [Planctomycetota bacterium]